jgi:uncharacterized membrane protein YeaQ/YmgE (transglycosylase-associated protein family)
MFIAAWMLLGLGAGLIGSRAANKRHQGIALGVVGAVVGGYGFQLAGRHGVSGFNIWSLFVAGVGATSVLWIYQRSLPRLLRSRQDDAREE